MIKVYKKELIFQLLLHATIFIFYSIDKHNPHVHFYQVAFFTNYAIAAFLINYILLPRLYYNKKYWKFVISGVLLLAWVIIVEEFVLEQIFFPISRGQVFTGFFYTLFDIMPVILLLTGFKFAWDAHQKHKEVTALQHEIKESELRFLKSQINPHFLFNNLNNLYSYATENSPKTPTIILELSSVLRYMLYDCKEDFVPLSKEIEHLQNFTQLNQLQIEERGHVTFSSTNSMGSYKIAPLILSVFVENAFKHSTASQNKDITIEVKIAVSSKGILSFECRNSFTPIGNVQGLTSGIGLENVNKRLELMYPNKHSLNIQSTEREYIVKLEISLN